MSEYGACWNDTSRKTRNSWPTKSARVKLFLQINLTWIGLAWHRTCDSATKELSRDTDPLFSHGMGIRRGRESSVYITTRYGSGRSGDRIPVGAIFCTPVQTDPGVTQPLTQWVPSVFPGGKAAGAGRWPPTPISRRCWRKSRTIHLLPFWAFVACNRVNFNYGYSASFHEVWVYWSLRVNHPEIKNIWSPSLVPVSCMLWCLSKWTYRLENVVKM